MNLLANQNGFSRLTIAESGKLSSESLWLGFVFWLTAAGNWAIPPDTHFSKCRWHTNIFYSTSVLERMPLHPIFTVRVLPCYLLAESTLDVSFRMPLLIALIWNGMLSRDWVQLVTRFGLVIGFTEHFQKVTTNNHDSSIVLHTQKITVTTSHIKSSVFTTRCLVAASNDGRSPSFVFPNCPQPQFSASHFSQL
jgi:hypothetical protein